MSTILRAIITLTLLSGSSLSAAPAPTKPPAPRFLAAPHFGLTDLGLLPHIADDIAPGLSADGAVATWTARSDGGFQFRYWRSIPGPSMTMNAPGADTFAADVNGHGLVVGFVRDPRDLRFVQAFQWHDGDSATALLPALGGAHAAARAVSDSGLIVGGADLASGLHHACLWRNGTAQDLGVLSGGDFSIASGLNAHEEIVGASDVTANGKSHAFLWSRGRMRDLGILPGGSLSVARAINDSGEAVGYGDIYGGIIHSVLWRKGHPIDLGTLGDDPAAAWSVNDAGQVVGNSAIGPGKMHAFFWQHGIMHDLNDLIPPRSGWVLETACRINGRGWILGTGRLRGEVRLFLLRPVAAGK